MSKGKEEILNSKVYQIQGEAYQEVGLYNLAIDSLTKSINKDPVNKEAYFNGAISYFESGLFNEALNDYLSSKKKTDTSYTPSTSDLFREGLFKGLSKGIA